ncbi:hypothetical protein [Natrinema salinisoli]|uniref:hypothetical protein n=1 Tax=Natrinema salinisoli TaxID=2878535 RepID=UPI001CF0890D|nr:hypothetical protein [Natrinema salinisoli]
MTDNEFTSSGNPDMSEYGKTMTELPDWKQPAPRGTRSMTVDQLKQYGVEDHIDLDETVLIPSQQNLPEEKWY